MSLDQQEKQKADRRWDSFSHVVCHLPQIMGPRLRAPLFLYLLSFHPSDRLDTPNS